MDGKKRGEKRLSKQCYDVTHAKTVVLERLCAYFGILAIQSTCTYSVGLMYINDIVVAPCLPAAQTVWTQYKLLPRTCQNELIFSFLSIYAPSCFCLLLLLPPLNPPFFTILIFSLPGSPSLPVPFPLLSPSPLHPSLPLSCRNPKTPTAKHKWCWFISVKL